MSHPTPRPSFVAVCPARGVLRRPSPAAQTVRRSASPPTGRPANNDSLCRPCRGRTLHRLGLVRDQPRRRRYRRLGGRVPPRSRHRRRRHLRRARGGLDRPGQPAGRAPKANGSEQRAGNLERTGAMWSSRHSPRICSRPVSRLWRSRWCCAGTELSGEIVLVGRTKPARSLLAVQSVAPDLSDDGNRVVFVYGGGLSRGGGPRLPGRHLPAATSPQAR